MKALSKLSLLLFLILVGQAHSQGDELNGDSNKAVTKPNIIVILCDDLGIGDVRAFNPASKIATPYIDRLAAEGMRFLDAHTSSSVCTPTRYSLLTGRYNWRTRLQRGVQGGMSPPLISPDRSTIAGMLKRQGYWTACAGKWHLGLEWQNKDKATNFDDKIEQGSAGWQVDFERPFLNGPTTRGFDEFLGISASLDMIPYTFLKNDRVVAIPTVDRDFPMMLHGKRGRTRKGPAAESFDANQVLEKLTDQTVAWVKERADEAKSGQPFFIYVPLASPHTPIVPTAKWQGKSGLNPYADFVMETDAAVGRILHQLEESGIDDNTLIVFTSDNGCSDQADFKTLEAAGHFSSASYRGFKSKVYEGGHRVPFIVRWPNQVTANTNCSALIGLQDLYATFAELVSSPLAANEAEDSIPFANQLRTPEKQSERQSLVHHSLHGRFSLRSGNWKLVFWPDGGGFGDKIANGDWQTPLKLSQLQLFDLQQDPSEKNNIAESNLEVVRKLSEEMKAIIAKGASRRSTEGSNDVDVHWKHPDI